MSDAASILIEKANSLRPRRYERIVLRSIVSATFGLICLLSVVFLVRSYTWRDRMVVPLSDARFCRIDSDRGKFEFESYEPNMGEMSFSVTAFSRKKISKGWKRFMNVPEPGPGKQWRWERSTTGRFFIHVPHWFVLGLTLVFAAVPWLRWRYSLRALLVATTVLAMIFGFWAWSTSTTKITSAALPVVNIDEDGQFEEMLKAVDNVLGNRLQYMKMGAMISATYQFSGSIDTVVEVIDPLVKQSGYSSVERDVTKQSLQEGQEQMNALADTKMDMTGSKMYMHKSGNVIHVLSMDITNNTWETPVKMKMLTIQMMNSKKMSESGVPKQEAIEE
jgi:hypothetical protein